MKTFLYCLTSVRNGKEDGVTVYGGDNYNFTQVLAVIDAENAESAAKALGTNIQDYIDRGSSVGSPTIYRISPINNRIQCHEGSGIGEFFFSIKELAREDSIHRNLPELIAKKVTVR